MRCLLFVYMLTKKSKKNKNVYIKCEIKYHVIRLNNKINILNTSVICKKKHRHKLFYLYLI